MKLIDMLVKETIENGWQWPAGYKSISQDGARSCHKGNIYAYINQLNRIRYWIEDHNSGYGLLLFKGYEVAEDARTSLVTREQYEAALDAKNGSWIEWGGGKIPVDNAAVVDIKFRTGEISSGVEPGTYYWPHTGHESDIIAYRLHRPHEAAHTKADDEADMNECIWQDAAPVWGGEGGTPSVGCVCECSWAGNEWMSCKILFVSDQLVVVKLKESDREDAYNIGDVIFRPLRTEAECKRDAAIEIMTQILCSPSQASATAKKIYDAIAAGKIPGVKLEGL